MTLPEISYGELFAYLSRLGFHSTSRSGLDSVFEHPQKGIVLVFSLAASDDAASGADLLSAEIHLQYQGLLVGPIQDAIRGARMRHD